MPLVGYQIGRLSFLQQGYPYRWPVELLLYQRFGQVYCLEIGIGDHTYVLALQAEILKFLLIFLMLQGR